jgi:hypothetical protein
MSLYAENTTVPVHRSRAEIEGLLVKHKASQYLTAHDSERGQAVVQFKIQNRIVRFVVKLPQLADYAKRRDRRGYTLTDAKKEDVRAQDERQRWRALLLVIKAKLECVENGIATFEEEFLAHIVLPNDQTVAQVILPRIADAYEGGSALLLPAHKETEH